MENTKSTIKLHPEFDVTGIKHLKAEVFWLEFEYLHDFFQRRDEDIEDLTLPYIICNGNSGRNYHKDVIDVQLISHLIGTTYQDIYVMDLSRNGIYHSLPEMLFHSMAIGSEFENVEDIKSAIRLNRKKTDEAYRFFAIFDNEIFLKKTALYRRQLGWDSDDQQFVKKLIQQFLMLEKANSTKQAKLLLSTLSQHQELKCNLDALSEFLTVLINKKVVVKAVRHEFDELPYAALGDGLLGLTIGLSGKCYAELDDLLVEIWLDEERDLNTKTIREKKYLLGIMELFDISSNSIQIQYRVEKEEDGILIGDNGYLGLNTVL